MKNVAIQMGLLRARPDLSKRVGYQRYELKFRLPVSLQDALRDFAEPYMIVDHHAQGRADSRYTVRSIYYDTEDLLFYSEKADSVNIRKKLRIRSYDWPEDDAPAFLEIKRKRGRRSAKERVDFPLDLVQPALERSDPGEIVASRPFVERKILERFRYNIQVKRLRPVVLVTYDREPYIGRDNERLRMTFDCNIRSRMNPVLDELFEEEALRQFEDDHFILELKFDQRIPRWMANMMKAFNLSYHSYSKYCQGIDAWLRRPK